MLITNVLGKARKKPNSCGHVRNFQTPLPYGKTRFFADTKNKYIFFFDMHIKRSRIVKYVWFCLKKSFLQSHLVGDVLLCGWFQLTMMPNEYISQNISTKYIFLRFRTFCIFEEKKIISFGQGIDSPPNPFTDMSAILLGFFYFFPLLESRKKTFSNCSAITPPPPPGPETLKTGGFFCF